MTSTTKIVGALAFFMPLQKNGACIYVIFFGTDLSIGDVFGEDF